MANKLVVAPAPHVQTSQSTARIMRDVVIALMPALVVSMVVFGVDVLRVTALSVACCVLFEYLIQRFLVGGSLTIGNWSAVVTGVLLAFNLPASIPWWIVVIGAFVAIAIAKMTFGGLGKNPFNPALVGACVPADRLPGADDFVPDAGERSLRRTFGRYAAGGRETRRCPRRARRAGTAAGQHARLTGRGGGIGTDLRFRIPALAPRHHVADSRVGARYDGRIRVCRGPRFGQYRAGAVAIPAVPCTGRRSSAGRDIHGDGLFDLADDRQRGCDLRHRYRRHHDVHPPVGRLSRGYVVRDTDHERLCAPDQQICQPGVSG